MRFFRNWFASASSPTRLSVEKFEPLILLSASCGNIEYGVDPTCEPIPQSECTPPSDAHTSNAHGVFHGEYPKPSSPCPIANDPTDDCIAADRYNEFDDRSPCQQPPLHSSLLLCSQTTPPNSCAVGSQDNHGLSGHLIACGSKTDHGLQPCDAAKSPPQQHTHQCSEQPDRDPTRTQEPAYSRCNTESMDESDSILAWIDVMLQANANDHALSQPEQGGPILSSRAFAIVSSAMYDAYNTIEKIGDSYFAHVESVEGANSDAAVSEAAYETLVALFPSQKAFFDQALHANLAKVTDGYGEDSGRGIGSQVAQAILAERLDDGYDTLSGDGYIANGKPGFHNVDPLNPNQGFYAPNAGALKPFVIPNSSVFRIRPH